MNMRVAVVARRVSTLTSVLVLSGVVQNFLKPKYVICMLHNERGDLVTGDSNGTVYVWGNGGNNITNFIKHGHDVSVGLRPV